MTMKHSDNRRLPTPEAPNNSRAPGPKKRKPFVLVVTYRAFGSRSWVLRRHYATKEARAQARKVEERSRFQPITIEEIDE